MEVSEKTIHGLQTFFIHQEASKSCSVQIWFRAGSSLENKDNQGIAHFLEHMFFKGSKKYPGSKIAKIAESYGGEINAFTSFDYTCYYINAPQDALNKSLDILLDMVANPTFSPEDFEPEKGVVFEEYRRAVDSPSQHNFFEIQKSCFPKQYKHPILGTPKTIKSFSREQLLKFRSQFYNFQNAFLVVAGDLKNKNRVLKTIDQYKLPSGEFSKFSKFQLSKNTQIRSHQKHVNQVSLSFTIQAPAQTDNLSPAEDLAINCLAYGENSPLYQNLIHKSSVASGVSGSSMFFANGGVHFLKIACPPENVNKALKAYEKTIKDVITNGLTEDEVRRIQNQYVASKIYEKESLESFSFALAHSYAQSNNMHSDAEFINKMAQVKTDEVIEAIKRIFSRSVHCSIQVPFSCDVKSFNDVCLTTNENIQKHIDKIKPTHSKLKKQISKFDPTVSLIELTPNIKLLYRFNDLTPTFVLHAYLKGGVILEDETNNGVYHLLAKSITNGNSKLSASELKNELELKSSYLNGFAGKNAYGITLHGLSEHREFLIENFFDCLQRPAFPNEYLTIEKELLKRTYHIQEEDPLKQAFKNFNKLVFNGHPYSQDLIGTQKSLNKINRNTLVKTHAQRLSESTLLLSYCGDLKVENLLELLAPHIKSLKNKNKNIPAKKLRPINDQQINLQFDREQTQVIIGRSSFKVGSVEDLYLKIFSTYLSGQSSELFLKVRDELGLCYAVQPLHHTALDAGYWGIYIGTGHDKKERAILEIQKIINKYAQKGLKSSDFNRVKKMIKGQNQLSLQTNEDYANFYSVPILHGLGLDYQNIAFKKMDEMSIEKFNKFLKDFLSLPMNIVCAGK